MLKDALAGGPSEGGVLTLADADACFENVRRTTGSGSSARRTEILAGLLGRASGTEREFLQRLVMGEMRHGALEGVMMEAVAKASGLPSRSVRRAYFVNGSLGQVASVALGEGEAGLSGFRLAPGRPILPALAQPCDDVADAMRQLGTAALEYKMDGARVQVHKVGSDVAVFTRGLRDVAAAVPELVETVRGLGAGDLILDGEVLAFRPDGKPHPFQTTMRRFGRKLDVAELRRELPLTPYFFDCLHVDGDALIDAPGRERIDALAATVPAALRMPRMITDSPAAAEAFFAAAVSAGHEGVMAKAPDGLYEAGERSRSWLKIKRVHTLDLVVLAAEWGHGRRRGWLSNLHLGARDPSSGSFVMLGKTFKGLTDAMLSGADGGPAAARDRPGPAHGLRTTGGGGGGGLQRPSGEPAVPRRSGAAIRPGQAVPARQARRTGGHHRDRASDPRGGERRVGACLDRSRATVTGGFGPPSPGSSCGAGFRVGSSVLLFSRSETAAARCRPCARCCCRSRCGEGCRRT